MIKLDLDLLNSINELYLTIEELQIKYVELCDSLLDNIDVNSLSNKELLELIELLPFGFHKSELRTLYNQRRTYE